MYIVIYGLAGASLMAGVGLLRKAAFERRRLGARLAADPNASRRIQRGVVSGWICVVAAAAVMLLVFVAR